jgi:hypothetical protein
VHRSRLTQILIDCNESVFDQGVAFWSQALGLDPDPGDPPDDRYVSLIGDAARTRILVQRVADQSSFHLDIETDDVEAEVQRLEKLGAVRKYKLHSWWVMRAPSGHDFCVIRAQTDDFPDEHASAWGDGG